MENGSAPEIIAKPTPYSEFRKLKSISPILNCTLLSMTNSGASVAIDGIIKTASTAIIKTRRSPNSKREKTYAALTATSTENKETLTDSSTEFFNRVKKLTGLLVG